MQVNYLIIGYLPTKQDREWLLSFDFRIKSGTFVKKYMQTTGDEVWKHKFFPLPVPSSPFPAKILGVAFLRHKRKAEAALRKAAKKQGEMGASGRTEGSCSPCNRAQASWAGKRPAAQQSPWFTTEATCKKRMRRDRRLEQKQCQGVTEFEAMKMSLRDLFWLDLWKCQGNY